MLGLAALAASALTLLVATAITAQQPATPTPDFAGYLVRWRRLHGDYDPRRNLWLRGWLALAYRVARPPARAGVHPDLLTLWSVWLASAVFVPAQAGGRWPILAGGILLLSGLGDTVDGAVAALSDRATQWGYVLDSVTDRVADLLYVAAVWTLGAPAWLAIGVAATAFLLEYLRARAANAGAGDVVVVTVGERATRVAFCAAAILLGGVFPRHAELVATVGLATLAALSVVGLVQLASAAHRLLAGRVHP